MSDLSDTYDEKAHELAEHFLQDDSPTEARKHSLALAIQQAVEDWFWQSEHAPVESSEP